MEKFPETSKLKAEIGDAIMENLVYRDIKSVYDIRKYTKNKKEYYYGFSFPIVKWENYLKKNNIELIKKIEISKVRNLFLVKFR